MASPHLMLFIYLAVPLSMMLFVFRGRSRVLLGFLLAGVFMCLFAGEINGLILNETDLPMRVLTVNVTPIAEEMLKAIPIVFLAIVFKTDRQLLLECSIAVGVGFATMENASLLFDSASTLSVGMIIARGLGSGMMHGVSTFTIGYFMTLVGPGKKASFTGTVAALSVAIIYHSVYNITVQSAYPMIGIVLPMVTFPLVIIMSKRISTTSIADSNE